MKKQPKIFLPVHLRNVAIARLGLKSEEVLSEQVCFHAQQAVEKVLKMVMLYNKI